MKRFSFKYLLPTILVPLTLGMSSCKEEVAPAPFTTEQEVNNWIFDDMKTWYYWNSKIPTSPNFQLDPEAFFESLLYRYDANTRPDGDRFSWIQKSAQELEESLSGVTTTTGMEYALYRQNNTNSVYGVILYTLPGSPAHIAGLRRGDYFTGIDGTTLTVDNYQSLLSKSGSITYTKGILNEANQVVPSNETVSITPVKFQENPVHLDTVLTLGSKRVGYVVYNQFIPSPDGSDKNEFDQQLEKLFANFKQSQINELVLDLRYNGGGYVSSAVTLASLIGKNVSTDKIFYIKEYNPLITQALEKEYGKDFFEEKFKKLEGNVGSQLQRVFILTTNRTASASELVINGLKPYMPVILIGGTTVGKNVGSITLKDEKNRTGWGMQPIVSKSFNSLKQSDYTAGFTPDYSVSEGKVIYPFANPNDPFLGQALQLISGSNTARIQTPEQNQPVDDLLKMSIEQKISYGTQIEATPMIK